MDQPRQRPKASQDVAARMIAQIIREKLAVDTDLGTEADLLARFGVARGTLREALRQLEWQGVVRMQRGIGGGLRVSRPGSYVPMFTLKVFFELARIDPVMLRRALRACQEALASPLHVNGNRVLELFVQATDGQFVAALEGSRADRSAKLSEIIAFRLTLEIEDRDLKPGECLGSETELIGRMGVGRGVLRESLSLMELNRVIELRRGASGGVFVHEPSPAFTIYVASVYLALADIGAGEILRAQRSLMVALGEPDPCLGGDFGTAKLALLAEACAARTANPVWMVLLPIFARYWRDFGPQGFPDKGLVAA